jgi:hypothetical protein
MDQGASGTARKDFLGAKEKKRERKKGHIVKLSVASQETFCGGFLKSSNIFVNFNNLVYWDFYKTMLN